MIINRLVDNFRDLYGRLNAGRRKDKRIEARLDRLEAAIAALKGNADAGFDVALQHVAPVTPLMIIERLVVGSDETGYPDIGGVAIDYFRARRLELDPAPYAGETTNRWRIDPDFDTQDYVVMATPGSTGFFPGCMVWACLTHEARIWGYSNEIKYEGEVYVAIAGEHNGFAGRAGAPAANPTSTPGQYYAWDQYFSGLSYLDSYFSGQVIEFIDPADPENPFAPSFTLPVALQLESLSREAAITSYLGVPAGTPIWLRYLNKQIGDVPFSTGVFVFNHATHPESEPCAPTKEE